MTYPIVKTPNKFREILNAKPGQPIEPQNPAIPDEKIVFPTYFPNKFVFDTSDLVKHALAISITTVLVAGVINKNPLNYFFSLLTTIWILPLLTYLFVLMPSLFSDIKEYLNARQRFKADVKRYIIAHKEYPGFYEQHLMPEYKRRYASWLDEKELLKTEKEIANFRRKLLVTLLSKIRKPLVHGNHARIRKGVSEDYVAHALANYFVGKVHTNGSIAPASDATTAKGPLPDILIHDLDKGYSFVIEIDEPYELQYGQPIHCLGEDDERDNYFLNENWGVIRFAEVQFITQPEICCDFIAYTINKITAGLAELPVKGKYLALNKVPVWTEKEARQMETDDFRATYLLKEVLYNSVLGSGAASRKQRRKDLEIRMESENPSH